jgi:hypothetical protein
MDQGDEIGKVRQRSAQKTKIEENSRDPARTMEDDSDEDELMGREVGVGRANCGRGNLGGVCFGGWFRRLTLSLKA